MALRDFFKTVKHEIVEGYQSFSTPFLKVGGANLTLPYVNGRNQTNGYIPFGPVDLDLRYIISYNNFEGFRPGVGVITNDSFSKKIRFEGYTAYGLKDETIKYNLGSAVRIGNFSNTWVGGSYTDDVREIASTSFATDKRAFKLYDPRPINISTFYNHKTWRGYLETKIIPKTETIWQLSHSEITPLFNYTFLYGDSLYRNFSMTTAMFSMQWNPFSDFMQTPNGKIEYEKRFPKFSFQFTKSLPNFFANDFDFRDSRDASIIPFSHCGLKIVHHSLMNWFFPMVTKFGGGVESCHLFNILEICSSKISLEAEDVIPIIAYFAIRFSNVDLFGLFIIFSHIILSSYKVLIYSSFDYFKIIFPILFFPANQAKFSFTNLIV